MARLHIGPWGKTAKEITTACTGGLAGAPRS